MLDLETIDIMGWNKTQEIDRYLWKLIQDGVIIDIDGRDLLPLISRTNASSMHYVGEICKDNKKTIITVLRNTYADNYCIDNSSCYEEIEKMDNSIDEIEDNFTIKNVKSFIRKNSGWGIHICKDHIVELVY